MNIREHPMAWRWTDPAHAVFSEETLGQLQALDIAEAERLFETSLRFISCDGLSLQMFAKIVRQCADVTAEAGRDWLRAQQPDLSAQVSVSWQQDIALRTTWRIFTEYWDDFCYPSSDDILVWPEREEWALFYSHEEEFQFGRRL